MQAARQTPPVLSLRGVSKAFAGQRVLHDVELDLHAGEVHAIVGHNGSGKSTLVKTLAGVHQPEPGARAEVAGEPLPLGDARAAHAAGLRFVHQDLGLVEVLDVVDNMMLGGDYPRLVGPAIDWGQARRTAARHLRELGYQIDVTLPVAELPQAERTGVAIGRALLGDTDDVRVLVFDEPTAALAEPEVEHLFGVIRDLAARGIAIVYISHHLDEVVAIADTVTVLRDGRRVARLDAKQTSEDELIAWMLGADHEALAQADVAEAAPRGTHGLLTLHGLGGARLAELSLTVDGGEIVGVAGLTGSGREEVAALLFGAEPRTGKVLVDGRVLPPGRPDRAVRLGMACLPADRQLRSLLPEMSVADNLTIGVVGDYAVRGVLRRDRERSDVARWLDRLQVAPRDPSRPILQLSGGNQQRVILGRWLATKPRALVLDEPTQGVDVGATLAIYELIRQAAREGTAILVCSSDTEELVELCDRVVVLGAGRVQAELTGERMTRAAIDAISLRTATNARAA